MIESILIQVSFISINETRKSFISNKTDLPFENYTQQILENIQDEYIIFPYMNMVATNCLFVVIIASIAIFSRTKHRTKLEIELKRPKKSKESRWNRKKGNKTYEPSSHSPMEMKF